MHEIIGEASASTQGGKLAPEPDQASAAVLASAPKIKTDEGEGKFYHDLTETNSVRKIAPARAAI